MKLPGELDGAFRTIWSGGTVPIFSVISAFVVGYLCPSGHDYLAALLGACYWSLVSLLKGAPKFLEGLLLDGEICTGNYYPLLLVMLFIVKYFFAGRFSLLSDGLYFLLPSLLLLCREVEVKMEVNENVKVRLAISILVT